MCQECHHSPHLSGCPNEPAPEYREICHCCGDEIYEWEEYWEDAEGYPLCKLCVEVMSGRELMEYLKMELKNPEMDIF